MKSYRRMSVVIGSIFLFFVFAHAEFANANQITEEKHIVFEKSIMVTNQAEESKAVEFKSSFLNAEPSPYSSLQGEKVNVKSIASFLSTSKKGTRTYRDSFTIAPKQTKAFRYQSAIDLAKVNYNLTAVNKSLPYTQIPQTIKQYLLPSYQIDELRPHTRDFSHELGRIFFVYVLF